MSLSNLAPPPKAEATAPAPHPIEQDVTAERVEIDNVPFIKFSSKAGAIYLPNLKRDELSPKRLEQAQCASGMNKSVTHSTEIASAEANLTEEFKPYFAVIMNTIQSKCDNNSDRNNSAGPPNLEVGVKYQPQVKKPGDELESYKAFARPLGGNLGVGKNF